MAGTGVGSLPRQEQESSGEFFIPDLCSPRSVFIMVLLSELLVLVYALADSTLPRFNWDLLAISSLFVQWVVLLSAALLCLMRSIFSRLSLQAATACSMAIVLSVTALSSYLTLMFYPLLFIGGTDNWWVLRNVLVATVISGLVLRYFYLQQQVKLRERGEMQARLDSLRARIRPHFLFNTMNSIASLIDSRPADAEQAVLDLSELFRASLQDNFRSTTVDDELRLCQLYLGIEQLRLGERLQVEWQMDESLRALPMPGLLLQPLVENAVYHGIAQLPEGGVISIEVARIEERLQVVITNPVPESSQHTSGLHMALANIEQRLQGLFDGAATLELSRDNGNYRVQLSYPLETLS
ncbi:MAG: histidine kinase [Halioglobus sp.]